MGFSSSSSSSSSTTSMKSQKWAETPFALISEIHAVDIVPASVPKSHACFYWARQMALIHNTIIRALNASYNQCEMVAPGTQQAADFLLFNQTLFEVLDHHHKVEEEHMFPQIEELLGQPGAMETNVAQHHAFEAGLARFERYVLGTSPDDYDGRTFRQMIDSFGNVLVTHLHDEIPSLLSLHTLDSAAMMKIWAKAEYEATHDADPYTNLCFLWGCQDNTFEIDGQVTPWPPVPFFLPWLINFWFSKKHAGSWKFSPSDFKRMPKPLMFSA